MMKVKVLQPIDDSTEIAYSISASAAGGIVSSRFVHEHSPGGGDLTKITLKARPPFEVSTAITY